MSDDDGIDFSASTHRLVTRERPGLRDWDENGPVTVENRAMDVVFEYGRTVRLRIEEEHDAFGRIERALERVPESERVFAASGPEFRARLPADRKFVRSVLAVSPGDTDKWVDRCFSLEEFAVLTDSSWLYRSVPHHGHVRDINAAGRDALLEDLHELLDAVRWSTVVPADGVFSWTAGGTDYGIEWDRLVERRGGDYVASYDLERLQYVDAGRGHGELAFEWEPSSAASLPRRLVRRLLEPEAATPPTRVATPDSPTADEALDAFRRLRTELDYDFVVDGSPAGSSVNR